MTGIKDTVRSAIIADFRQWENGWSGLGHFLALCKLKRELIAAAREGE